MSNQETPVPGEQPLGPVDAAIYRALLERYNKLVLEKAQEEAALRKGLEELKSTSADVRISVQALMHEVQCVKADALHQKQRNDDLHKEMMRVVDRAKALEAQAVRCKEVDELARLECGQPLPNGLDSDALLGEFTPWRRIIKVCASYGYQGYSESPMELIYQMGNELRELKKAQAV